MAAPSFSAPCCDHITGRPCVNPQYLVPAMTLGEINERLKQNGYYQKFQPEGIEVVSWYVMMGMETLKVPAEQLREINRVIEESDGAVIARSSI